MNDLVTNPGSQLVPVAGSNFPVLNEAQKVSALRLNPNDTDVQALVLTCMRYNLDPVLKHAVLIQKSLYVTRDGLLHVAHMSGQFDGIICKQLPETDTHYVAICRVHRKDMGHPFEYMGRFPKTGKSQSREYGPEMAEKVAECRTLRRAFDISLCSREEMWDMVDDGDRIQSPTSTRVPPTAQYASAPVPQEAPPGPPVEPKKTPLELAKIRYSKAAHTAGFDVLTNGKIDYDKLDTLYLQQTNKNPERADADDWAHAAQVLPNYKPGPAQAPEGYIPAHSAPPAPVDTAPVQPSGTFRNTFPTPNTPSPEALADRSSIRPMTLPASNDIADADFDDPFADDAPKPRSNYAGAGTEKGAA